MKNIKQILSIVLLFSVFAFVSCETEPIDSAINLDDFNQPTCNVPSAFQASSFINNNSISLSWVAGGDETTWTIEYGAQGFVQGTGTTVIASTTTYLVTGLNSSNSYSFYIKANCSTDSSSQWVGPVNVQGIVVNPNCPNPSGLSATRDTTTNTNVNVAWTLGATEASWEIQYGMTGFVIGTGNSVISTSTTKQVTGISATVTYDFYVRAICSATQNSGWIGPIVVNAVTQTTTIAGTYKLTAFNTSPATDLNGDGTPHINQMDEVDCLNNMFLTINANNTYTADAKGVDLDIVSGNYTCFVDPTDTGTWVLNGNQLTVTSNDTTLDPFTFTVSGNTLSNLVPAGTVYDNQNGVVLEITSDITTIYTKQ
ncbi:fibronectin type III domain-containing protein [Flavobacterium phycosphaerae]|uniref:fibronectin type III domain-containing protein n=1 Tax=Flavobacterium phycosphaerae TaxID=2697515 RepID=UPI0013899041|nr:fibronectin type III domain-containing protein [Flavobacterium phycosphaerae]